MNHHYIEYMVKQRQQRVLEECERRRMLHSAGYDHSGALSMGVRRLIGVLQRLRWPGLRSAGLPLRLSVVHSLATRKGEKL